MTNPYEITAVPQGQLSVARRPWLVCLIVTFVAMLVWFGFLGISILAWLSVLALIVFAPINANLIAPFIAHLCGRSMVYATVLHVGVGLILLSGPFYWPSIVRQVPSIRWTMYPSFLIFSWVPPILFGSFCYTMIWIKRLRKNESNPTADGNDTPVTQ